MRIRFAEHGDVEAILALAEEIFSHGRFAALTFDHEKVRQVVTHAVDNPGYFLALAETADGELAGVHLANMENFFFAKEPFAQSVTFFVRPDFRGTSAAPKLLAALRKWAAKRGAHELVVGTGESEGQDLEKTDRFLRKMGLEPTGGNYVQRLARP